MQAIKETHFKFPNQTGFYKGKVRDVYYFGEKMAMVATDRISAFDVVLPKGIPDKGRILNQIAGYNLNATKDIVPNWVLSTPDPNVTTGFKCEPFAVEMVIRGYLAGHAWREYKLGKRSICGVALPEGLRENDRLPHPIITPTTKAKVGHDEDISREEILSRGIVEEEDYRILEDYTYKLYQRGTELAALRGLILVDTKYEFGKQQNKIYLIDEVHTPDSSRYFYKEGYEARQKSGEAQKQLSKEFVRQWLIENGFQGKEGQKIPEMTDQIVANISSRYQELYQQMTGEKLPPIDYSGIEKRIEQSIVKSLN
ncbi:MAG: phosphoribosylaminoimidazolesuccinocarboxamide synthase [Cytophagales bacterium]|jgi:phosphoribosylaminoimidazole-succinocarboxamide synthase|nr:phosphoribosylaminoimidazolesuccinocarboxamide synthase [Cytophagales bacterium]MCA6387833.1 phosphoribosylaminoimidazolesuccinocarboxamide synthase [Cytophagales bacterium]MCA6391437.1 phosphoribosylaminoimidazolesuccinocarboxamide synthase [Cytophagales bacterium]MCA6396280.1 phosphoribosylaminoimidazolesuccinocarboxamide synthase [Cytophagales bacterium]MCA6397159.1 phosphoribosylaminoimidazolesuccinocarboxamide synthase [Cytophagales bacterium]